MRATIPPVASRPSLKVYSSRSFLPPGLEKSHVTILSPFWGRNENVGAAKWPDYADRLIECGREFLELTELPDADVAVFPLQCRLLFKRDDGIERAQAFADLSRAQGKRAVFFYDHIDVGRFHDHFPVDDAVILRSSIFRSRRTPTEFALPGFHDDLLKYTSGELPVRRRPRKRVVSFCGSVFRNSEAASVPAKARRLVGDARRMLWRMQGRHEEDLFARARAIDALRGQRELDTSFVTREAGHGSAWLTDDGEDWNTTRMNFVRNVIDSDYVLAPRGVDNWSVRFYEALCLGRIPIVVDTDIVLPYDFVLPWRDYCVWVDRRDVNRIGDRVAEFDERLSDDEFVELQRECRRLWEEFLSPHGFFRQFFRHFDLRADTASELAR